MKRFVWLLIIGAIVACALYFVFHPFVYSTMYFEKIGIKDVWLYKKIISDKGAPIRSKKINNELKVYYDGLTLVFDEEITDYFLKRAEITGKQYRYGIRSIGIGSTRNQIQDAYRNIQKMIDLDKDEYGVIDNGVWVSFVFNSDDKVKKILLTHGP